MVLRQQFEQFLFHAANYYRAIRGVTRPHRLVLPTRPPVFKQRYFLSEAKRREWLNLYQVSDYNKSYPFTYFLPASVHIFHAFLNSVRVNFKHVLHLKTDIFFTDPRESVMAPGLEYDVEVVLENVRELQKKGRAALCFNTIISNPQGQIIMDVKDLFIIKNLAEQNMESVKNSKLFDGKMNLSSNGAASRAGSPFKTESDFKKKEVYFAEDLGSKYGGVSGDTNIVHTNKYIVRLFGYRKIFAQGLCTANYVLKHLHELAPVRTVSIAFCKPVFLGQLVSFKIDENHFEVCDPEDNILAFGNWKKFDAPFAAL